MQSTSAPSSRSRCSGQVHKRARLCCARVDRLPCAHILATDSWLLCGLPAQTGDRRHCLRHAAHLGRLYIQRLHQDQRHPFDRDLARCHVHGHLSGLVLISGMGVSPTASAVLRLTTGGVPRVRPGLLVRHHRRRPRPPRRRRHRSRRHRRPCRRCPRRLPRRRRRPRPPPTTSSAYAADDFVVAPNLALADNLVVAAAAALPARFRRPHLHSLVVIAAARMPDAAAPPRLPCTCASSARVLASALPAVWAHPWHMLWFWAWGACSMWVHAGAALRLSLWSEAA